MGAAANGQDPVLNVSHLETTFATPEGEVKAVSDVSFSVNAGEAVGLVGESGSGKSQIFMSIMGLLASNGRAQGRVTFQGTDILDLPARELNRIRGVRMSMIFQDPMTSLNPYLRVSRQMTEVLIEHKGASMADARKASIGMLERVQIPEAARRIGMYPHEFSGGMRQRVMIAMALLCEPELLIADEPTTALDVTVQAQILELVGGLRRDLNMALVLITHDMGVIAGMCERVMVMYAGRVIEAAPVNELFHSPQHPYTAGLLRSMPRLDESSETRLATIAGQPPNLQRLPAGCAFRDRCDYRMEICARQVPPLASITPSRSKACHLQAL